MSAGKIIFYILGLIFILVGVYFFSLIISSMPYTLYAFEGIGYSIVALIIGIVLVYAGRRY